MLVTFDRLQITLRAQTVHLETSSWENGWEIGES